jgi:hypothetical protein
MVGCLSNTDYEMQPAQPLASRLLSGITSRNKVIGNYRDSQ